MAELVNIWIPGKPAAKGSMRGFTLGKSRHVRVEPSNVGALKMWTAHIRAHVGQIFQRPPIGRDVPVGISMRFIFAKPSSAPKRRKYPTVKPDVDKLCRAVLDALTGYLYRDDAQVVDGPPLAKRYSNDGSEGLILKVWTIESGREDDTQ